MIRSLPGQILNLSNPARVGTNKSFSPIPGPDKHISDISKSCLGPARQASQNSCGNEGMRTGLLKWSSSTLYLIQTFIFSQDRIYGCDALQIVQGMSVNVGQTYQKIA